jgi:hypothetical protein
MILIGIDPGTPVTIAVLSPDGTAILDMIDGERLATFEKKVGRKHASPENNPELIAAALRPYAVLRAKVAIERVSAMPGQGISSTVRFVGSMYLTQGIAAGLGLPAVRVTPSVWKRAMGLTADKERSRAEALRRWPSRKDLFSRKKDHDRAEAALLAAWLHQLRT